MKILTLKCPSCGAALEIAPDMERFACGYCGTEQIVQRRGGTVALKAITAAITQIQIGTDRTAAELAIQRLSRELATLAEQASEADAVLNGSLATRYFWYGLFWWMTATVFGIPTLFAGGFRAGGEMILPGAVFVFGIVCFIYSANENNRCQSWKQTRNSIEQQRSGLLRDLAKNRALVDGK